MLKKIFSNSLILLFSTIFSKLFVLSINLIMAKYNPAETYGQFALIRSSVNMIETTVSSALNPLIVKVASSEVDSSNRGAIYSIIFAGNVIFAISLSLPIVIFIDDISLFILGEIDTAMIYIAAALISLTLANGALISIFIASANYNTILTSSAITFFLVLPSSYFLIPPYQGQGALFCMAIFNIIDMTVKIYLSRTSCTFQRTKGQLAFLAKKIFKLFARASFFLVSASLLNAASFWLVRLLLVNNPDGFKELAKFDIGFQFILVAFIVLNSITTVFLSLIARSKGLSKGSSTLIWLNLFLALIFSISMSLVIYLSSPYVIGFFSKEYSSDVLEYMSIIPILYSVAIVLNRYMIAMERCHILLWVSIYSSIGMLIYSLFFVSNALELVFSFMLYYGISVVVYLYFIVKYRYTTFFQKGS
jgi:O-antigen/teichoic acid export membrane protein